MKYFEAELIVIWALIYFFFLIRCLFSSEQGTLFLRKDFISGVSLCFSGKSVKYCAFHADDSAFQSFPTMLVLTTQTSSLSSERRVSLALPAALGVAQNER